MERLKGTSARKQVNQYMMPSAWQSESTNRLLFESPTAWIAAPGDPAVHAQVDDTLYHQKRTFQ